MLMSTCLKNYKGKEKMKVALLQISAEKTIEETKKKGLQYCEKAKEQGADIALFPEMFSNGYNIYDRPVADWVAEAIPEKHEFVQAFKAQAKELGIAIGITFLEECVTGPKNTIILFDRLGNKTFKYSKFHTCDFDAERNLTPGDEFYVTDLDTKEGIIKVGAMICYDREFPESARILMLKGAEIILVPNACPMEINRLSQLRGRAYENMVGIATCNYPATVPDCNGHSNAFDGVAFLPELPGSRDTCIVEADGTEGIWIADFDMEMLRKYRSKEVQGNAFRRPDKYQILCSEEIKEPFIRKQRR